eukprot:357162-Chlamydomonas_euryale.AAC.5
MHARMHACVQTRLRACLSARVASCDISAGAFTGSTRLHLSIRAAERAGTERRPAAPRGGRGRAGAEEAAEQRGCGQGRAERRKRGICYNKQLVGSGECLSLAGNKNGAGLGWAPDTWQRQLLWRGQPQERRPVLTWQQQQLSAAAAAQHRVAATVCARAMSEADDVSYGGGDPNGPLAKKIKLKVRKPGSDGDGGSGAAPPHGDPTTQRPRKVRIKAAPSASVASGGVSPTPSATSPAPSTSEATGGGGGARSRRGRSVRMRAVDEDYVAYDDALGGPFGAEQDDDDPDELPEHDLEVGRRQLSRAISGAVPAAFESAEGMEKGYKLACVYQHVEDRHGLLNRPRFCAPTCVVKISMLEALGFVWVWWYPHCPNTFAIAREGAQAA